MENIVKRSLASSAVLGLICALLCSGCDRGQHPRQLGRAAPDFTIRDGSQTLGLSQFRGKVVLLNFWATWCPPCIDELPSLMDLHRRMPQLVILAVSMDSDGQAYRNFLLENGIGFATIRNPSYRVAHLYGTYQIPESYVIDRRGHIVRKYVSAQDWTSPEILRTLTAVENSRQ